jgi:hypothetical protein
MSISIADIMDSLLRDSVVNLPPEALAEVFDRLIWCLADNGHELLQVRDSWLRSDDRSKIAVALAMDETFPFDGGDLMREELGRIATRWPEFADRCGEIVAAWHLQQRR